MDPLTAGLSSLSTADKSSDLANNSTARHNHAATDGSMTPDGSLHAHSSIADSSNDNNSEGVAADEAADVLSPLGSPRAVSSPIPVPASNGLSSGHRHFDPDIKYPKSGLSPRSSSPGTISHSPVATPTQTSLATRPNSGGSGGQGDSRSGGGSGGSSGNGAPAPSPPDPDLDPEVLGQLLQKHASPAIKDHRFSMDEFLKNKAELATAARRELTGGRQSTANDDDVGSCLEGRVQA